MYTATSIHFKLQKVKGLIHFDCYYYYYCFSSFKNAMAIWNMPATNSITGYNNEYVASVQEPDTAIVWIPPWGLL